MEKSEFNEARENLAALEKGSLDIQSEKYILYILLNFCSYIKITLKQNMIRYDLIQLDPAYSVKNEKYY